jgi:hypothetical protein
VNPWKVTAIGMAVMMVTALVTGLVVANWTGADRAAQTQKVQTQATPARVTSAPAVPTRTAIDACNKYAASDGVVGAGGGTLYGLNENKKQDERYRAAYASCMRARGFTS